jgi:hypothetical protein
MLRIKAAHGHASPHSAVHQLVAIILAWLLLAGVAAAQTQTQTKSESGSNHLRGVI